MNNLIAQPNEDYQSEDILASTLARVEEINQQLGNGDMPDGFELDEEGVWYLCPQRSGSKPPVRMWICSPLQVTAYCRDERNEGHGCVLEFADIAGHQHRYVMPRKLLANDKEILGELFDKGLKILQDGQAKKMLVRYIAMCEPISRYRSINQTGWCGKVFVLQSETIGAPLGEKVIYQGHDPIELTTHCKGTLEEWQRGISLPACRNSRLILALCASFAGPLLQPMNHENIGIHLRGSSSLGKSTAGLIANSVWGHRKGIQSFRATANGLEGIAALHNDRLLCLDELGQLFPQEAGQVVYMLGNGMGKRRANQQGGAKGSAAWRLVFLSTGELSLAHHMEEVGKRVRAGQEVRLIEIPADTGVYGVFEELHRWEGGAEFARHLNEACSHAFGTPSREYLKALTRDIPQAAEHAKRSIEAIQKIYLHEGASGQVVRVFGHFALIAAAGELATLFGITGWDKDDATRGVMKCYEDWLEARGDIGPQEDQRALDQVREFFQLHGESRFSRWSEDPDRESRTIKRAGFRRPAEDGQGGDVEFFAYPQVFKTEICRGLDHRYVARLCIEHGLLMPGSDGSPTRPERLPGSSKTSRCYRFLPNVLSDYEVNDGK